jgi:hypothetical protein
VTSRRFGKDLHMAGDDDLFTTLRKRGLRKSVAQAIADAERMGKDGGAKAEALARSTLDDLNKAAETIRARVLDGGSRSTAASKAAATRKRDAAKRSEAAKRGAATRKARATKSR